MATSVKDGIYTGKLLNNLDAQGHQIENLDQANLGLVGAFTDLSDVPATYAGASNKYVSVKADATGLQFSTAAFARVYRGTDFTVANNTMTAVPFTLERDDASGLHTGTEAKLTALTAGVYVVSASLSFEPNSTGIRLYTIRLNGGYHIAIGTVGAPSATIPAHATITTLWNMTANDYVEACVQQTSGGNLLISAILNYSPEFSMVRVA